MAARKHAKSRRGIPFFKKKKNKNAVAETSSVDAKKKSAGDKIKEGLKKAGSVIAKGAKTTGAAVAKGAKKAGTVVAKGAKAAASAIKTAFTPDMTLSDGVWPKEPKDDAGCKWNYKIPGRCEPVEYCVRKFKFGDLHLSQSCRKRSLKEQKELEKEWRENNPTKAIQRAENEGVSELHAREKAQVDKWRHKKKISTTDDPVEWATKKYGKRPCKEGTSDADAKKQNCDNKVACKWNYHIPGKC